MAMCVKLNKKAKERILKGILVGIILIGIFSLIMVSGNEANMTNETTVNSSVETITNTTVESLVSANGLSIKDNKINYKFDEGETEITLYRNNVLFDNIYIEEKEDKRGWKFGATDNSLSGSETATYKYILSSTNNLVLLEKQKFDEEDNFTYKYPIVYNYYPNPDDEWKEYRHIYDFEDICSKENSGCEWKFDEKSIEITFTSNRDIDPSIENVSSCRTLGTANQYYQLNKSIVVTSGDCIVINNNSITFDCNSYSITGSNNDSGIYSSKPNMTVKNCNISMGSGSGGYGIELSGGPVYDLNNAYIYNSTLSNQYNGIRMIGGFVVYYKNLRVEKVTANSNADSGIYISPTKPLNNSVFKDIIANSNGNAGIYLASGSNNTFTNITANSNLVYGIDYGSGSKNIFTDITANSNSVGMSIESSNDILTNLNLHSNEWGLSIVADFHNVSDSNISNSSTDDVWIGSSNNIFLSVSYNTSKENVDSGSLIRKWYYRAYVNDTGGKNISLANITIHNKTNDFMKELITERDIYADFDGINGWINATKQSWITKYGQYSFSTWVYIKEDNDDRSVLIQNSNSETDRNCLWIGNDSSNHWASVGYYNGSWHSVSGYLSTNSWHHVIGVNNGGNLSIYINGVQQYESKGAYCHNNPAYLYIGRQSNNLDYIYNGSMDDIMIFNKSLSAVEAKEIYNRGKVYNPYTSSNLVSAWRFSNPDDENVVDSVGNNNGTFNGNVTYGIFDSGFTDIYEIIDYINNAGTRNYYSNYTIYADKTCYPSYRTSYNVTEQKNNLKHVLTLSSSTYQNWAWNFADNCNMTNLTFNMNNYSISSYNSGTWNFKNITINNLADFKMNSTGIWRFYGYPRFELVEA